MQIRTRLTLQFLLIGGMIMVISSLAIYFSSSQFRKDDFYNRLHTRARITAKLLLDAQEAADSRVRRIEQDYPSNLQNEKIIIMNYLNDTIYSNDERGDIKIRYDILERIRLYDKVFYKQGHYEVLGTLYTNSRYRFVVIAGAIDSEGIMHLKKLETILIVVCLLSFVLFSVAGWVFAGRALKPIANVVKRVEDISFTSINLRVPEGNGTDEIGKLAKTFNSMLERLQTSINVQKDFIANASHELRTPLTSINGQIEVLLLKNRSTEEYRNALQSVLDDIKSLTDLANKLLLMARTGQETRITYNNKIRTDEILWQIREEMRKYKPGFNINISFDDSLTDSDQMLVAGDEYLLKTAFSNIIENACKYSDDHSVEISLQQYFNKVHITFTDKGIGIDEKDIKKVFEPFYRASNAISIPGTGIGLSLVSQILRNHNGTIELTSVKNKGTIVKISLPSLLV
jgi:signal transduction histidine kinase